MMRAVRGIYRDGVVELLEQPDVAEDASIGQNAQPLDDFEPMLPLKLVRLSDLVLEGRE